MSRALRRVAASFCCVAALPADSAAGMSYSAATTRVAAMSPDVRRNATADFSASCKMRTVRSRGVLREDDRTPAVATIDRIANSRASFGRTTASSSMAINPGSARTSAFGACLRNSSRKSSPIIGTTATMNAGDEFPRRIVALSGPLATRTSSPSASSSVMYGAGDTGGGA